MNINTAPPRNDPLRVASLPGDEFPLIPVDADRVFRWNCLAILFLVLAHLAVMWSSLEAGHDYLMGIAPRLQLFAEASVPAFFSALLLAAAAGLAALLAPLDGAIRPGDRRCWSFIALLLLFMAFDEAASIHELLNRFGSGGHSAGVLYYVWVVPYGILALGCAAVLLPFWWRLPASTRFWLAASAAIYCFSAIGLELVESALVAEAPSRAEAYRSWAVVAAGTCEETGEMLGVALAIRTLLRHIGRMPGARAAGQPRRIFGFAIR